MSVVGLNLSSSKISIIELMKSRKDISIRNMVKAELPSNSIVGGSAPFWAQLYMIKKGVQFF